MKSLVSTNWLDKNLENVRVFDASWHLPIANRDAFKEFKEGHIKNSIFFNIDENSNQNSSLPHMLTEKKDWEKILSKMGIKNEDKIIIYDNSDVISSCRCWFNFIYFGHDPNLVHILNGGFKKWIKENRKVSKDLPHYEKSDYQSFEKKDLVKDKNSIDENIETQTFKVIDARSKERFDGKVPEPRKGLRSGKIKNSFCIPFNYCINDDKTFKSKIELEKSCHLRVCSNLCICIT